MASLVISAVGAAVGFMATGTPAGAQWGWMLGSMAASSMVEGPTVEGQRLSDLRAMTGSAGVGIHRAYGTVRIAGNVIWAKPLTEIRTETEQSGGGKGGGGSTKTVQYTYSQSFAVGLCECGSNGPIGGIRKIWLNNELVYNLDENADLQTLQASNSAATGWTLHRGDYNQAPDPLIQAHEGVGNTPAYRNLAYIVFNELLLTDYGNRTPNVEVEVSTYGYVQRSDLHVGSYSTNLFHSYDPSGWGYFTPRILHRSSVWTEGDYVYALRNDGKFDKSPVGIAWDSMASLVHLPDVPMSCRWNGGSDSGAWNLYAHDCSNVFKMGAYWYVRARQSDGSFKWVQFNETGSTVLGHGNTGSTAGQYYNLGGTVVRVGGKADNSSTLSASIQYSTDLSTWYNATGSAPVAAEYVYTMHKGELYAIGWVSKSDYAMPVIKTTNGTSWSSVSNVTPPYPTSGTYYRSDQYKLAGNAFWSDGQYLWYAAHAYILRSADNGVTWTLWTTTLAYGWDYLQSLASRNASCITSSNNRLWFDVSRDEYFYHGEGTTAHVYQAPLHDVFVNSGVPVRDIIDTELYPLVQLSWNSDALASKLVTGYYTTGRRTIRQVIEDLQPIFYFDVVESDDMLKFVPRGGASVATIPEKDMAVHEFGAEPGDNLETVVVQEYDMPLEVSIGYLESESSNQQSVQYARRWFNTGGSLTGYQTQNIVSLGTNIVLTAAKARQAAEVVLWNAWMHRVSFKFTTTRKYMHLEPTDVVTIQKGNASHVVRLTGKQEDGQIITWSAVREDASTYTQTPPAASLPPTSGVVVPRTSSRGDLMDIPLLRDTDEGAGFYAAFSPTASPYRWEGAGLYRSVDGGATWATYGPSATAVSVVGNANGVLGNFTAGNIFDEQNTVSVTLLAGSLSSVSESVVLAGGNMALLGDEIIQFKNATLTGTLTYTLSGILRGCRGTEWAMGTHASSDRFVLLTDSTTYRATESTSEIGLARKYKAVTYGMEIAGATEMTFTNTGASLKPLAPVHIGGGRDASGNLTIQWTRRTRLGGEWRDNVDVQIGEAGEFYDVDVMNGSTVVRTLTSISSEVTYSAAQQTTDFGSPQSSVTVKVYQRSAVIGRGFPGTATI